MMVWKGKTPLNLWLSWGILSQISTHLAGG